MAVPKKLSGLKRFGARYGRSLKQRFIEIENLQRKKYKCPYCAFQTVKRLSKGIWECGKCKAKFANKAFTVTKKKSAKELMAEMMAKQKKEELKNIEEQPQEEEEIIEKIKG